MNSVIERGIDVTVFADMEQKRVVYAVRIEEFHGNAHRGPGRDAIGHPHAITDAAIDMGLAYQSGVREN